jgi:DNA-binding LacI/PurR family transcriptional regulator
VPGQRGQKEPAATRRATIKDVAQLAGVSKGAASRALSPDGGRIGQEAIARVRAAAEKLGYVPNIRARSLSAARAYAIGWVMRRDPDVLTEDPFFPSFLAGVEAAISLRNYTLVLSIVTDELEEPTYRRLASEGRVDGFLLSDVRARESRFALLTDLQVPAVAIGVPGSSCPFPAIGIDDRKGAELATEHLLASGRQRVAHVTGPPGYIHTHNRHLGWRAAMRKAGKSYVAESVADFTPEGGAKATRALLDSPDPPDAIFYDNDLMAMAGMAAAISRGVRVPRDLAVVGFDNIPMAAHLAPPLSSVATDTRDWGKLAALTLLDTIDGRDTRGQIILESGLVVRKSSDGVSKPSDARGGLPKQ